ncbi:hypothetical protein KA005_46990, partial [bacterium]|nr:hypothetical protein [bacterium]
MNTVKELAAIVICVTFRQYEEYTLTLAKQSAQKDTESQGDPIRPIRFRLLLPLTIITLLLIGLSAGALLIIQQRNQQQFSRHLRLDVDTSLKLSLKRKSLMISAITATFLNNPQLHIAMQEQDREQLLTLSSSLFQKLRDNYSITHLYFHRPDLVNLVRIHKPEKYGDYIDRFTAIAAKRQGTIASGIELGPLGTFTLRVVQPVYVDKTLIGFVELGQEIEGIMNLIHKRLGVELVVTFHKEYLERQQWELGMKMLDRNAHWNRYKNVTSSYSTISSLPSELDPFLCGEKNYRQGKVANQQVQFDNKSWRIAN